MARNSHASYEANDHQRMPVLLTSLKKAIVNLVASGKTITFTRADGSTDTLTTQDTTYTAGSGLSLSGTKFNHSNSVTAGTAGTSSATSGRATLAIPYVTYDAQGHVTASGTHTHTISVVSASTSTTNGGSGLVPVPSSSWYDNRKRVFLSGNGTWEYLPLANNSTTTAEHYALDARMGKTLNDRIASVVNRCNYTTGNGVLNTVFVNSGGYAAYAKQRCYDKYVTTVTFDVNFKSSYSSDNVAKIASALPTPVLGGLVFLCAGNSFGGSAYYGYVLIDDVGSMKPWYCSTVSGHWFGSVTYISN